MKHSLKPLLVLALGLTVAFGVTGCGSNGAPQGAAAEARTPVPSNDTRDVAQ